MRGRLGKTSKRKMRNTVFLHEYPLCKYQDAELFQLEKKKKKGSAERLDEYKLAWKLGEGF